MQLEMSSGDGVSTNGKCVFSVQILKKQDKVQHFHSLFYSFGNFLSQTWQAVMYSCNSSKFDNIASFQCLVTEETLLSEDAEPFVSLSYS